MSKLAGSCSPGQECENPAKPNFAAEIETRLAKLAGKEISDDPSVLLSEALDRSGLTDIVMDTNAVAEKFSRGTVGVSGLTGHAMDVDLYPLLRHVG